MVRKLENYSLDDLVEAFASKFGLRILEWSGEVLPKNIGSEELPAIVCMANKKKRGKYLILFKNNLTIGSYHVDSLTKPKILKPQEHFEFFKLNQLETSREKAVKTETNK